MQTRSPQWPWWWLTWCGKKADFRQPDWQHAFYGANYEKLRAVKARYDPEDVFYALTAVGSDEWEVSGDGRLCRVRTEEAFSRSYLREL